MDQQARAIRGEHLTEKPTWRETRALPLDHRFDPTAPGGVYSRQCLVLPREWLDPPARWTEAQIAALGPFYFQRLSRLSRRLVAIEEREEEVRFRLALLGLPLFRFAAPTVHLTTGGGRLCYAIKGGMVARSGAAPGTLCLEVGEAPGGTRLCMEVKGYQPRLMGSPFGALRRLLYSYSQATLHHIIAEDYVRHLAFALAHGRPLDARRGSEG